MSNKKSKKHQRPTEPQETKEAKKISHAALKRAAILIANTTILTFIYFGSMAIGQPILSAIVTLGYWSAFASLLIVYVIYNRGFTRKSVTEEMLPDSWGKEKKKKYVEDAQKRYNDSKWMLYVIIPIMIPIALDAISLFTWPMIRSLLGLN